MAGGITLNGAIQTSLTVSYATPTSHGENIYMYMRYVLGNTTAMAWTMEFMDPDLDTTYYYQPISESATFVVTTPSHSLAAAGNIRYPIPLLEKEKTVRVLFSFTGTAIEGLSAAAACVVTYTTHGLATNDYVSFEAITQADWTVLNRNIYKITKINANSFSIPVDTSGIGVPYNAGVDGGTINTSAALPNLALMFRESK